MSEPPVPRRRRISAAQIMGVCTAAAFAFGVVVVVAAAREGRHIPTDSTAFLWGFAAVIVLSCVLTLPYWRRLDEAAKEAHKSAWIWGGGVGFVLATFLALLVLGTPMADWLPSFTHRPDGPGRFADGVFLTVALQAVCYVVAWSIWWWRRR